MMASTTVEPVRRSHAEARRTYDRISMVYDWVEGPFETRARRAGLTLLDVQSGERVLDAGHGTGHALVHLAHRVGPSGFAAGIDLSAGMQHVARHRLQKAGTRATLIRADAVALPFQNSSFDAAFMSFVLELFDTPDIPAVLGELRRVLEPRGRVGIVALGTREESTRMSRLYLAAHRRFPRLLDCRPIPTAELIRGAGFHLQLSVHTSMWGLPVDVVVASPG
jgi:demethylmenaquinone methyltransferase/2-methoxy-6-polyprenyl-1,4-benzoquinol methylase